MKLMTWNIKGCQTARIINYVTSVEEVDLMILTEYRILKSGDKIQAALANAGWPYLYSSYPGPNERGVLIAAREPMVQEPLRDTFAFGSLAPYLNHRIVETRIPSTNLLIVGVYIPYYDGVEKNTLWNALIRYAQTHAQDSFIIAGDVNSCTASETEGSATYTSQPLHTIQRLTIDAWETYQKGKNQIARDRYTWYAKDSGIRLDYVFLSPVLQSALVKAEHVHHVREAKISDHSAVVVTLNI